MLSIVPLFLALGIVSTPQTPAKPVREYTIDVPKSKVEFFVGSSVGDVNGSFGVWRGEFKVATPGVPESATLTLEIVAPSMSTGNGMKDKTIKGKKFFYVQQYPTISFTSTRVIPTADPNKSQVEGDFTLRGVTRSATLQVTLDRDGTGGGQIFADLAFDRRDFGMTQNVPLVHVGDSVRVRLDISFALKMSAVGGLGQISRRVDLAASVAETKSRLST